MRARSASRASGRRPAGKRVSGFRRNGVWGAPRARRSGGIMRVLTSFLLAAWLSVAAKAVPAEDAPLVATAPTMSATEIVFAYGGFLWTVPRAGGEARQLTTGGHESNPYFSPDGKWIAF